LSAGSVFLVTRSLNKPQESKTHVRASLELLGRGRHAQLIIISFPKVVFRSFGDMQAQRKSTLTFKGQTPPSAITVRRSIHAAKVMEDQQARAARLKAESERKREIIVMLCERFPHAFSLKQRRPLKVGIHKDLLAALEDTIPRNELDGAMKYYVRGLSYLQSLVAGGQRIDLQGNEAGEISEADKQDAMHHLKRAEQRQERAQKRNGNDR
jgi:sRNA-binding protein